MTSITPERWRRIKAAVADAAPLRGAERGARLDAACGSDADLRAEVESLLAAHDAAASGFLEHPTPDLKSAAGGSHHSPGTLGQQVGPYRLVGELGHGGMADVFAAVRADGQYEQHVAVKLVRGGSGGDALRDRFRTERQILASLEHPNIARLLDGGTTEAGAPYLVMERVDGRPIDDYCRAHQLPLPARLAIFLRVCAAVSYAHRRLVIHRDIKPGNILVTDQGVPKLLDFGIAKLFDSVGNVEETALRPFTPAYASPEQVRGDTVSTASDVYALGMVLYLLLTGRSPYRLSARTPQALADAVTGQPPDRPSTAVRRLDDDSPADRDLFARQHRALRGDLDVILLKALRKEPEQRYSSVDQFAEDVRRYLAGLPVAARKGTWSYHAGKFARRHRGGVAAAVLVLATLVGGIVATTIEARIARANQRRADARFEDVRKLANSLLFEIHDAIQDLPGATDARRLILQRSLEYLDSLEREPGEEPSLQRELATAYGRIAQLQGNPFSMTLGDTKSAGASYRKALAMRESLAARNPENRDDRIELAVVYLHYAEFQVGAAGNPGAALEYARRGIASLDRELVNTPDDRHVLDPLLEGLTSVGMMQTGNGLMSRSGSLREGLTVLERALGLTRRASALAAGDAGLRFREGTLELLLGDAMLKLGERPQALEHYQSGRAILEPLARSGTMITAAFNDTATIGKIGDVLLIEGRLAEAQRYYTEYERAVAQLASADPHNESLVTQLAVAQAELGHALIENGRIEEGLAYCRKAAAGLQSDTADTPVVRATEFLIRGWLGEGLERRGRIREALGEYDLAKQAIDAALAAAPSNARMQGFAAAAGNRVASALERVGDLDRAEREYHEALGRVESLAHADPEDQELAYVLAETYAAHGRIAARRTATTRARAEQLVQWETAAGWFRKSLETWNRVPHPAAVSTSGFEVTPPAEVARELARCQRAIGAARTASASVPRGH